MKGATVQHADIAFVCSNDLHVATFAPVADELVALGRTAAFVSLDPFYQQHAATAMADRGIAAVEPLVCGLARDDFFRRPTQLVWLDVLRARAPIARLLGEVDPRVVVVGNDRGLIEKSFLSAARRRGAATVLVQDGHIGRKPTPETTFRRRAWRRARRAASAVLIRAGARSFAATDYGTWGCDLVCASGSDGVAAFRSRGVDPQRIVVTGQPRYDEAHPGERTGSTVVWFTTPFEAQNLGSASQASQERMVAEAVEVLADAGVSLTVKIHPREDASRYHRLVDGRGSSVATGSARDALASAELAIVGISSVTEEAVLAGVPVAVATPLEARRTYEQLLPPSGAFPRVGRGIDVLELVRMLRAQPAAREDLLTRQRDAFASRVVRSTGATAAHRVAAVVAELAERGEPRTR